MAPDSNPHSESHLCIEFFLADGSLAQAGQSFVLVPKLDARSPSPRRFRRLASLNVTH